MFSKKNKSNSQEKSQLSSEQPSITASEFSGAVESFEAFLKSALIDLTKERKATLDKHATISEYLSCELIHGSKGLADALRLNGSTYAWEALRGDLRLCDVIPLLRFLNREDDEAEHQRILSFMESSGVAASYSTASILRLKNALGELAQKYIRPMTEAKLTYEIRCLEACRDDIEARLAKAKLELGV